MNKAELAGWTTCPIVPNKPSTMEDAIAYFARVSNPTSQTNNLKGDKLLKYLIRNKHWSPFEMCNVVVEVNTSRDIARQLLRHRSFSFQEFSQRYSATETTIGVRECRLQDTLNRQNSLSNENKELEDWWVSKQRSVLGSAFEIYDQALKKGIAKEQARAILPEGLTLTKLYVNGTVRSWVHYVELRTDPSTQKEHRDLASKVADEISKVFPLIEQFVHGYNDSEQYELPL